MQLIQLEHGHWNFFCPVTGKEVYKEEGGINLILVGFVGLGKASVDLLHVFWDGLVDAQRQELHRAAFDACVNLNRLLGNPALN